MPTATAPMKLVIKPFKGELPKRKGPNERKETPFDAPFAELVEAATEGRTVDGKLEHTTDIYHVPFKYEDPKELKPLQSMLRSALKLNDPDGVHGLRTWVVDDGVAFQIGPKVVRPTKEKKEAEETQTAA